MTMNTNPNFAAQSLCHYWSGGTYYNALALVFQHRITWACGKWGGRVHFAKQGAA